MCSPVICSIFAIHSAFSIVLAADFHTASPLWSILGLHLQHVWLTADGNSCGLHQGQLGFGLYYQVQYKLCFHHTVPRQSEIWHHHDPHEPSALMLFQQDFFSLLGMNNLSLKQQSLFSKVLSIYLSFFDDEYDAEPGVWEMTAVSKNAVLNIKIHVNGYW